MKERGSRCRPLPRVSEVENCSGPVPPPKFDKVNSSHQYGYSLPPTPPDSVRTGFQTHVSFGATADANGPMHFNDWYHFITGPELPHRHTPLASKDLTHLG